MKRDRDAEVYDEDEQNMDMEIEMELKKFNKTFQSQQKFNYKFDKNLKGPLEMHQEYLYWEKKRKE